MEDDWASEGDDDAGLGDLSAIPEVKIAERPIEPEVPPQKPQPPPNAWTTKPSSDVRNAVRRPQPNLRQPVQQQVPRPARRDIFPSSFSSASDRTERSASSRPSAASSHSRSVVLYVTHLPYDATENSIGQFFEAQGVRVADVRINRYSDTGNIKAAFVQIPQEQNTQTALDVDGLMFGSRNIKVKIDGTDGNRRRDRGGGGNSVSYGGSFGSRERREDSNNGWGGGGWGDRSGPSGDQMDRRSGSGGREERRRESSQPMDPTIPTGPPPAGRKKLQLKPRTKPLPVLEVDHRAIDVPKASSSALVGSGRDSRGAFSGAGSAARRSPNLSAPRSANREVDGNAPPGLATKPSDDQNGSEEWTAAKETSAVRPPASTPSLNKKEDDAKKPVLLNTFAALEVTDSDA